MAICCLMEKRYTIRTDSEFVGYTKFYDGYPRDESVYISLLSFRKMPSVRIWHRNRRCDG